jgi:hypothetical protein
MRKAIILGLALCLLSAVPVAASIQTGWTIHLGNVTGEGLTGDLTISDVQQVLFSGIGHTSINTTTGIASTDALFMATGVRDGGTNSVSTASEILNGPSVPGLKTFEITFALHATTQIISGSVGGQLQFLHLPGGTLDVWVQNTSNGTPGDLQRANPNLTVGNGSGGNGFMDGTQVAHLVDVGGIGNIDYPGLDGDDNTSFLAISGLGFPLNVLVSSDGLDMFNLPSALYPNLYAFALSDSNYHLDPDHNFVIDSGPPTNWPAGWSRSVNGASDFFFSEDGSATFEIIPEPATVMIWGLLGLCALGLVRIRGKR